MKEKKEQNTINLFWPIYLKIEKEFIESMNYIHFNDDQFNVYSNLFVDLLLKIGVEIETISKQLYLDNGGKEFENENEMYFDTVCIDYLEKKWTLSSKMVIINNINTFFSKEKRTLYPLNKANKRGTSGPKWKIAYQAVKHNRSKNYKMGNINNCINGLAALFILNIYYKDNKYIYKNMEELYKFDNTQSSQLFAIKLANSVTTSKVVTSDPTCCFYVDFTDEYKDEFNKTNRNLGNEYLKLLLNDQKVIKAINEQIIKITELGNMGKINNIIGKNKITEYANIASYKSGIDKIISNTRYQIKVNKTNMLVSGKKGK